MFRQAVPDLGLSLERGTEAVPDDGMFHVLVNGEDVLATESKQKAFARYKTLREQLAGDDERAAPPDRDELLRKLKADAEITAVLSASSQAKRAHATYKRGTAARWKSS
jgi:hypothetical protein